MAMRFSMEALRASTAFSPRYLNHHRRDGGGDQAESAVCSWCLKCS